MTEALFAELYARKPPETIKPGLERIARAHDYLGRPGYTTRTVLIAGTNGKGTTGGYLTQLLESAGLKVGFYTSPHLVHFCERYYVTGQPVTDAEVAEQVGALQACLPEDIWSELSFFEIATLVAMRVFAKANVDIRIMEVGLGGRWDATNVVDPEISVITSIGIDHVAFLGDDIAQIAREKAGVMRSQRPVVVGAVPAEVRVVLETCAKECGSRLDMMPPEAESLDYLTHNRQLARKAASYLVDIKDETEPRNQPVPLLGRFQQVTVTNGGTRELLFDVCHNVAGAEAFVKLLRQTKGEGPFPGFVSILADKDVDGILDVLRSILSPIVLFQGKNARSFSRLQIASRHRDLYFFEGFEDAFTASITKWDPHLPYIVCGSVATVGEVLHFFQAAQPDAMRTDEVHGRSPVGLPQPSDARV